MRTLHLHLKAEYFNAIAAGTKTEEYRKCTPYWTKRIEGREYDQIVLYYGYLSTHKVAHNVTIVLPYRGYKVRTITHPHFGPEPVEVFAIRLIP